jgi:tRNA pseudouridine55 synthase
MARRKKGRAINGWLVLDKPVGMTSTQAVGAIRRLFDARKAGHAGTLDPLATGVLPVALGEATKTVPYAVDGTKHYRFTVRWGAGTNTDDAEGEITETRALRPSREAIEELLPRFTGEIMQTPPAFSAIKVDGNRAYDLARAGEVVELEARSVQICRTPTPASSRLAAERAPTSERWPATWGSSSAASVT